MLFLYGVYIEDKYGVLRFRRVKAPTSDKLIKLTHTIAHRVGGYLDRKVCYWPLAVVLIPENGTH
jgi:hypothetical protein